jgi:DNA adenine methylase
LDPPYAPETGTSFVGYTMGGFDVDQHKILFNLCGLLKQKNVQMLMSNADVPLVREAFPAASYTTTIVSARRAIHSKDPSSKTKEVLIRNV